MRHMIVNFTDLDLKKDDPIEIIGQKVQDKLGVSLDDLQKVIGAKVAETASTLAADMPCIAPFGDYSKLLDKSELIEDFLKTEACKPDHWTLQVIAENQTNKTLIQFTFTCKAIDSEDFKGFVFVSKSGKIRHSFAQNDN